MAGKLPYAGVAAGYPLMAVAAQREHRRITEAIAGPFVIGDRPMAASAGIGPALRGDGARSADALRHRADGAMYDRKRRGSGRQSWNPELGAPDDFTAEFGAPVAAELRGLGAVSDFGTSYSALGDLSDRPSTCRCSTTPPAWPTGSCTHSSGSVRRAA